MGTECRFQVSRWMSGSVFVEVRPMHWCTAQAVFDTTRYAFCGRIYKVHNVEKARNDNVLLPVTSYGCFREHLNVQECIQVWRSGSMPTSLVEDPSREYLYTQI